jgi:hypothetical protein
MSENLIYSAIIHLLINGMGVYDSVFFFSVGPSVDRISFILDVILLNKKNGTV